MAWSIGFHMVACEVDCLELIRLILDSSAQFHIYDFIIRDIQRLLAQDGNCSVHHVYREGNQATDYLAKPGASTFGVEQLWDHPLTGLELILLADAARVLHLR